uniref:Uncharacterized protein n=1 Tax=Anopheles maculatus TaxID=74869 RepID=A0A182S8N5_9DIPT
MPMCAVSAAQYLTTNGWAELRNPIDTDVPFRLFRDEGRIYLQWLGEPELRQRMQGRLVLVHLMCRDMTPRLLLEDGRAALHHAPALEFFTLGKVPLINSTISNSNTVAFLVPFRAASIPLQTVKAVCRYTAHGTPCQGLAASDFGRCYNIARSPEHELWPGEEE